MQTSALPALRRPDGPRPSSSSRHLPWRDGPPLSRGLSAERERELAARIQEGDLDARNELVEGNLALVEWIVLEFSAFACAGVDLDDLTQEGRIGLMRAAECYDPATHGTRFSTYACYWVRQKMRRALLGQARTIRLPEYLWIRGIASQHQVQICELHPDHEGAGPAPLDSLVESEEREQFRGLLSSLTGGEALVVWRYLYQRTRRAHTQRDFQRALNTLINRLRNQVKQQEGADGTHQR